MEKTPQLPQSSLDRNESKNTTALSQKQTIFHYLQEHSATASMVADVNLFEKGGANE
jgi:hypothetical protein